MYILCTMQITLQKPASLHVIRGYDAHRVRLPERELTENFVLSADQLIADWEPRSVAELDATKLAPILALEPEVVLLATGARAVFPRAALRAEFGARAIGLEVMELGAACRTFNVLVSEGRRAVLAVLFD